MIIDDQLYELIREAIVVMAEIADTQGEEADTQLELFHANDVKSSWVEVLMRLDDAYAKSQGMTQ